MLLSCKYLVLIFDFIGAHSLKLSKQEKDFEVVFFFENFYFERVWIFLERQVLMCLNLNDCGTS